MELQSVIILTPIIFIIFILLFLIGGKIKLFSSLTLSSLLTMIILVIYYPINNIIYSSFNYYVALYFIYFFVGFLIISIYIVYNSILDQEKLLENK